jgi:DNA-binding transcriptional MerR regulator
MADQVTLPEGQEAFKLNEVCKLANVQPYMLRFWGTEFEQLEAEKSGTGQRMYSRDQVSLILEIRRLLFDEGLTIAGARKRVNAMQDEGKLPKPAKAKAAPAKKKAKTAPKPKAVASKEEPEPSAERATEAEPEEVDKPATEDVKPLVATLKHVRKDIAKIVADLKPES